MIFTTKNRQRSRVNDIDSPYRSKKKKRKKNEKEEGREVLAARSPNS